MECHKGHGGSWCTCNCYSCSPLSLAVEAFNLQLFEGTPVDAASFLIEKLDHLVSRFLLKDGLKDSEQHLRLNPLQHWQPCNCWIWNCAGWVIRALHTEGVLEHAYCTETPPFNQGSRLTAYELVHEKIPATLIADSAAAALTKARRVNAVIVGADPVAANGIYVLLNSFL